MVRLQVTVDLKLSLPQVAVVGSQSSGKSSVLEALVSAQECQGGWCCIAALAGGGRRKGHATSKAPRAAGRQAGRQAKGWARGEVGMQGIPCSAWASSVHGSHMRALAGSQMRTRNRCA